MRLKKEKEALQMFCDADGIRILYRSPHINDSDNGRLVATEGHIMALVAPKLLRCKYEHIDQQMPVYDLEVTDIGHVIGFKTIEKAYNRFHLIPEVVSKDGEPQECPECDGKGHVEFEYTAIDGEVYYEDCDCPVCDGTGLREDYEEVETGRMVLEERSTFGIKDKYIDVNLMMRVVTALRMMGFCRMMLKSIQRGALIFEVCDGFTVVIMSVLDKGKEHICICE